jgi:hypothetical protein
MKFLDSMVGIMKFLYLKRRNFIKKDRHIFHCGKWCFARTCGDWGFVNMFVNRAARVSKRLVILGTSQACLPKANEIKVFDFILFIFFSVIQVQNE